MMNSFLHSDFNSCPLVWHFCSFESSQKFEKIQKHFVRLVLDDYKKAYGNLIKKNGTTTMEIKRLRILPNEIFKTMNFSYIKNQLFMHEEYFHFKNKRKKKTTWYHSQTP